MKKNSTDRPISPTYRAIYRTIKRIPRGKVASYGQIARIAGLPNQARLVGYALHALRDSREKSIPWYRVMNAKGEIALPAPGDQDLQRGLLEHEGVRFSLANRIDLEIFGWKK